MKKIIGLAFVSVLLFHFTACSDRQQKQGDNASAFGIDSVDVHGVQRMQTSKSVQTVEMGGKKYSVSINRTPADSLVRVKNEQGDVYVDNLISLRITNDRGGNVYNKVFTKQNFSDIIQADFLSKSILEGMVFDRVSPSGLVFAASVSFPQTDLYVPVSITITSGGKMSMAKEELMEDTYTTEEQN